MEQKTTTDQSSLYPFLFVPAYAERIWGGTLLTEKLNRKLPESNMPIGEAWDIYDRKESSSIIENGPLKGKTLHDLMVNHRFELMGSSFSCETGDYFPLIVKIIDSAQNLSLQVHPSAEHCRILSKGEEKNEMWYILHAQKDARIYAGLSPMVTKTQFLDSLDADEKKLASLLQTFDACPGDAYFIYAGRIHAIGAGVLLLEIQQNSDTTYRVSDWGRVAPDGSRRELHVAESMTCIDFTDRTVARITGASDVSFHNRKYTILEKCKYFQVTNLKLVEEIYMNTNEGSKSSFHLISAADHPLTVETSSASVDIPAGRTCLVPASAGRYRIIPRTAEGETADVILTNC